MSFVFRDHKAGAPGTHVLAIGIGGYPYCGHKTGASTLLRSLEPLSSPPFSVHRFVRWLMGHHRNDQAPLRSVQLLVSGEASPEQTIQPSDADGRSGRWQPDQVGGATADDIRQAFNRWWAEGDSHPDNVMIFFYCGHGVQLDRHYILPDDLGAYGDFSPAFNITSTMNGTGACAARTQIWLIDACRNTPRQLRDELDDLGPPLRRAKMKGHAGLASTALMSATPYSKAWGRKQDTTVFTAALLDVLRGASASKTGNGDRRWEVQPAGLLAPMNHLLDERARTEGWSRQQVEFVGTGTGRLTQIDAPVISTTVECQPEARAERVRLHATPLDGGPGAQREPARGPWRTELPVGIYRFTGQPIDHGARRERLESVHPPRARVSLRW